MNVRSRVVAALAAPLVLAGVSGLSLAPTAQALPPSVHCVAATAANEVTPPPPLWQLKHESPPTNQSQPLCPAGSVPTPVPDAKGSASITAAPPVAATPTRPPEKPPTPTSAGDEAEPFGGVSPLLERTGYPAAPYYYAGDGYHTSESWYGLSTGIQVGNPTLSSTGVHSLGQIAVATPNVEYTSELGWIRTPTFGAGSRLFTYINKDKYKSNGEPGGDCYDCITMEVGSPYTLNQELTVGHDYQFTVAYYKEKWWWAIGPNWIGYEPESFWGGKFTSSTWLIMYGEVDDNGGPDSQMGNGTIGTKTGSIVMNNPYLYYANDEKLLTTAGHSNPEKDPYPNDLPAYNVGQYSSNGREWHYGGE
jgi:hypothetical protein